MKQNNSEEIDLMQILNSYKKVLIRILILFFNAWNFILGKWKIIISLLIIGVLLGYFLQSSYIPNKKADILLKVNFEATDYLYKEVDLINAKIGQKDSVFLTKLGLSINRLEIKSLEVKPVVNLNDVVKKYGGNERALESLLKNIEFKEEELILTETFISDYKYHTINFKLSNNATLKSVSSVIEYFNSNELLEKLRIKKTENLKNRIIYNNKTITQIDALIETYNSNKSITSSPNEIFVVDKNFNMDLILTNKMTLQRENEYLSQELIYLEDIFVVINKPQLINVDNKLNKNKMIYYPILLIGIFLFLATLKHLFYYLKEIAENA